ncbi:MAG: short-chain dehydrogenase [Rhodospirillales bacterium RIFCSPLOWO2_12_FULL_58_28]|nr:MAG: short-chain dehydrogenase [Rhodospirillales bacterium RIFCSPLOWO2_02_FULL_58_16]OHC77124.1 MAG: short-chain dehydrogenase [Rhodospirillales bacterium RIFCSPLOWO2_12_FULL_58_28]
MKNMWSDTEAKATVRAYAEKGVGEDLALRVYSARLLGSNPALVLHGGGNASVKTSIKDAAGVALFVKGSGSDMGLIEASGFAAVRMEPLLKLKSLDALSDREMDNARRCHLLDSRSPAPSVEFLLHAFLPHKFCDHTHADAVLSLTNQTNGEEMVRDVYKKRVGIVPYMKPGFGLAKKALEVFTADPAVEALVLLKHGLFTFAADALQAYALMIEMVTLAEKRLHKGRKTVFASASLPALPASAAEVAPILRGLCAVDGDKDKRPMVMAFRTGPRILEYVNGAEINRYSQVGAVTPDHAIRTGAYPLATPPPEAGKADAFREAARQAVKRYGAKRWESLERNGFYGGALDPMPRVILAPGLGLFGLGDSAGNAAIAADLAENTIAVITAAESVGTYESAPEADLIEFELWPLERAKLGDAAPKPFAGYVAAITGGGGVIGAAVAKAFVAEGAAVAVLDLDEDAAKATAKAIGGGALALGCDVTDPDSVGAAFAGICEAFGGVDIVVSNAGAAWQGTIGEVDEAILRKSFELNFFGHQTVAQNAVRIMRAQGIGGCLLFNTSKQAVNPGKDFGPYGLPKAATMFLVRQYALDHGGDGIRTGGVNADRIRSGLLTDGMIASRAGARGIDEKTYMAGNLLGREVTAEDVAQAFIYLAKAKASTADILTVDGGNMAACLR